MLRWDAQGTREGSPAGLHRAADLVRHGIADLVFPRAKVAVFLDGCFWHGCPVHFRKPKTNVGYWDAKIEGNRRRDAEVDAELDAADWIVIRVWEHEDMPSAAVTIAQAVRTRRGSSW